MDCLKRNLPEVKYLQNHVASNKKRLYLMTASKDFINCLNQIVLNILFSHKNGLELNSKEKKMLQPYHHNMKKFILTKKATEKRKILTSKCIEAVLATIIDIAERLEIEH